LNDGIALKPTRVHATDMRYSCRVFGSGS